MARKRYSDEERANALAALTANGGSVPITATRLGIPYRTLKHWADGDVQAAKLGNDKKEDLVAALRGLAWLILDMLPSKLKRADARSAAITLGIALDKAQLLSGQPTNITRTNELTDDQRRARLASFLGRLRTNRAGNGDGADHENGLAPQ